MSGWQLPTSAELGGRAYAVHTDYRDVLDVIEQLQAPDACAQERVYVALALFYERFRDIPREQLEEAVRYMMWFIACGKEEAPGAPAQPRLFDWEQDLLPIVADVNKVAGCEVRALPYLHWWTFIAYFNAIGEGPFSTLVGIRKKLKSHEKLDKWERDYYAKHRAEVDLAPRYTAEERAEIDRINALLGD